MGQRTIVHLTVPDPNNPGTMIATGQTQVIDTRDLSDAQADALACLDLQLDSLIAAGRNYSGKNFQIDSESLQKINGAAAMAMAAASMQQTFSTQWIASDNTLLPLDGPGMVVFGLNIGAYFSALVLNGRTLKTQIAALATIAACDSFDVAQGWPSN